MGLSLIHILQTVGRRGDARHIIEEKHLVVAVGVQVLDRHISHFIVVDDDIIVLLPINIAVDKDVVNRCV